MTGFVVAPDDEGARLDVYLAGHLEDTTRSRVGRLIAEGHVSVDGNPAGKAGLRLQGGMHIEVELPAHDPARELQPEDLPLNVVYEDDALIVLDKSAGVVVHPGHGQRNGTLVHALLGRGTPLAPAGGRDRPGIVHRLDLGTSGLLVVAKTDEAHRGLASAFARRLVHKRYLALVWGHPEPERGVIRRPIGRSRTNRLKMSVTASRGRPATTQYRTLESMPGFGFLELFPETGRTHQIRVHMQSLHHPIVGDIRYGGRPWRGVQDPLKRKALRQFERLALHAADLAFDHPISGQRVEFHAPLPADLEALRSVLRGGR